MLVEKRKVQLIALAAAILVAVWAIPAPTGAAPLSAEWENVVVDDSFAHAFLLAVEPQLRASVVGAYGAPVLLENPRVTGVRRLKKDPQVVEVAIHAMTIKGAHNPLGILYVVFGTTPLQIYVSSVRHELISR